MTVPRARKHSAPKERGARRTLAAIRTHRWDLEEEALFAALSPTFGPDVAVVYHNLPPEHDLPCRSVGIDDAWVRENGLRPLVDWAWRCGDYAYYALRQAFPEYDRYVLVEPDVLIKGDTAAFFESLTGVEGDAAAGWLGTPERPIIFSAGVTDRPLLQGYFPFTFLSASAIDYLFTERVRYSATEVGTRVFANDELFVFSWLSAAERFDLVDLSKTLPDWFGGYYRTNPDIVYDAVFAEDQPPHGIYHPVRSLESYCREIGRQIAASRRFAQLLEPSRASLDRGDAEMISDGFRDQLRQQLGRTRRPGARKQKPAMSKAAALIWSAAEMSPIRVIDVGANPIEGEAPYKALLDGGYAELTGFEPQPEALSELNAQKGPAETYLPYALGNGEKVNFRFYAHSGFASIYPVKRDVAALLGFGRATRRTGKARLQTKRLDDIAEVGQADYLKIDVQGSELSVIANARQKLADAVLIQSEVRFLPLYAGEPTFGDLEREMMEQGFRFHDFAFVKRLRLRSASSNVIGPRNFRQVIDGDAYFIRDLTTIENWSAEQLWRLALLAEAVIRSPNLVLFCLDELVRRRATSADLLQKVIPLLSDA